MITRDSIGGYEQKLLVTIQKFSDSKIQVLYWGNSSQMSVSDICTYDLYEEDFCDFEEQNVQWVEDTECEGSYIPVIINEHVVQEPKVCGYFEPKCDVSRWQKPVLIKQVDVIISDILNLVHLNALEAVEINIYAEPEGYFLADLIENRFQNITDKTLKNLIAKTDIVIRTCMDYESYNGEVDVKKRICEKQFLSFWQPQLEEVVQNIYEREELCKNYQRLSDNCIKEDLKLLQLRNDVGDFEDFFLQLIWKKATEAVERREQKIVTNAEHAKGQWMKEISVQMRDDIGADAKKLSELRHFKSLQGMNKELWQKKRREYLQKNRSYLIYWCFLMKCTVSEVEDLLTVAQIYPYPTNPGEQLLYSFMKRKDYDKKHLQEAITKVFPEKFLDIGQLLGIEIK
ncbi:MAG: hypothetical protein J6A94_02275 [Lachnospiraceae bacterium]|nr:hypothetical protein [Lachnospiraceae bacterium]